MKILVLLSVLLMAVPSFAERLYIKGLQSVTFRSGPGTENRIIKMIETDSPVTVLESGDEWTKVKDAEGNEGYILNRFLANETPYSIRYSWLTKKFEKLKEETQQLKESKTELNSSLSGSTKELTTLKEKLAATEAAFEELKLGSTKYLELKAKHDKAQALVSEQATRLRELESRLTAQYMIWFLAGAGVLLLGWLIGLITRKRRNMYASSIRL